MLLGNYHQRAIWVVALVFFQQTTVLARPNAVPNALPNAVPYSDSRSDVIVVPQLHGFEEWAIKRGTMSYPGDDDSSDDQNDQDDVIPDDQKDENDVVSDGQNDEQEDAMSQGQDDEERDAFKQLQTALASHTVNNIVYDFVAPKGDFGRGYLEMIITSEYDKSASPATPDEMIEKQIAILNHPINQEDFRVRKIAIKPTDWKSMMTCDLIQGNDGTRTLRTTMRVTGKQFGKYPYFLQWVIGEMWSVKWQDMKSNNKNNIFSILHPPKTTGSQNGKDMFAMRIILGKEYRDDFAQEEGAAEPQKALQELLDGLARPDVFGSFMKKNKGPITENLHSHWIRASPGMMKMAIVFQDEEHVLKSINTQLFSKAVSRLYGVPVEFDRDSRFVKYHPDYDAVDTSNARISYGQVPASEGTGEVFAVRIIYPDKFADKDNIDSEQILSGSGDSSSLSGSSDSSDSDIAGGTRMAALSMDDKTPGPDLPERKLRWLDHYVRIAISRNKLEKAYTTGNGWFDLNRAAEWAKSGDKFSPAIVLKDEARVVKDQGLFVDELAKLLGIHYTTKVVHFREPARNGEEQSIAPSTSRARRGDDGSDDLVPLLKDDGSFGEGNNDNPRGNPVDSAGNGNDNDESQDGAEQLDSKVLYWITRRAGPTTYYQKLFMVIVYGPEYELDGETPTSPHGISGHSKGAVALKGWMTSKEEEFKDDEVLFTGVGELWDSIKYEDDEYHVGHGRMRASVKVQDWFGTLDMPNAGRPPPSDTYAIDKFRGLVGEFYGVAINEQKQTTELQHGAEQLDSQVLYRIITRVGAFRKLIMVIVYGPEYELDDETPTSPDGISGHSKGAVALKSWMNSKKEEFENDETIPEHIGDFNDYIDYEDDEHHVGHGKLRASVTVQDRSGTLDMLHPMVGVTPTDDYAIDKFRGLVGQFYGVAINQQTQTQDLGLL